MVVGLVVEPIVDVVGSSSTSVTPSDGTDFAINDLYFRVKATDTTPYQRATAQFRKDQLDTGQSAGDQSLTGWWTRGQFSFHKGAGVTYYEVSEGETIQSRFLDGEGVDPFRPGKVTCQKAWNEFSTVVADVNYVSSIDANLVVLDGTTLKFGDFNGTPSTYAPAGSATVRAAATSPTLMYALLDNGKIASVDTSNTETTLYTGLTTTGRGIWYAKSRLIVSDSDGKWYQLATNPTSPPAAVGSGDVIFTAGAEWSSDSCLTDTPGPMLVGNSNRVFALTLDSNGTIPSLTAPVQIGELPPGETVSALAYHLGFVILVTGAGVRVGVLSDNGQLTYGPLLMERAAATTTPPATSVGRYGTRVSVVIDNRIIEIDLSQQVGNGLEFGWVGRGEPYTGSETAAGVTTLQISTQIAWGNDSLWKSTANYASGTLTTGYHRFNTLEPKRFDSVRVHGSGTGGTIEVTRVDADGTETSLYTIDMGTSHVEEVPLRLTDATETIGLKFSLTPKAGDATVTPTLLGYQLRALPEPQRQRLIRIPLLLDDVERRQPGRAKGRKGSAYTRLAELEDLEDTNALVTFRDFRTGETGRAYIESVEFENKTSPSATSKGFGGGVLMVTLRKL